MSDILTTTIDRSLAQGGPVNGYYVILQHGAPYFITGADANIIRLDMPFEPSGQWRARAVYNSHFKRLADWSLFAAHAADNQIPMTYKNGNPLYFIGDFDHGTDRVQRQRDAPYQPRPHGTPAR